MVNKALAIFLIVFLSGCSSIPPEASKLSHKVSKDFLVIQKNYLDLVHMLFRQKKQTVDELYDEYGVELRKRAFLEPEIQEIICAYTWDLVLVSDYISPEGISDKSDLKGVTNHVVKSCKKTEDFGYEAPDPKRKHEFGHQEAMNQFRAFMSELDYKHGQILYEERTSAIQTLENERDALIDEVNKSFATLNSAQSTLTAWVDSVVDVDKQQREVLKMVDLDDLQGDIDKFGEKAYKKLSKLNNDFENVKSYKNKICNLVPKKQNLCEGE
jgi:hypothetical protein